MRLPFMISRLGRETRSACLSDGIIPMKARVAHSTKSESNLSIGAREQSSWDAILSKTKDSRQTHEGATLAARASSKARNHVDLYSFAKPRQAMAKTRFCDRVARDAREVNGLRTRRQFD